DVGPDEASLVPKPPPGPGPPPLDPEPAPPPPPPAPPLLLPLPSPKPSPFVVELHAIASAEATREGTSRPPTTRRRFMTTSRSAPSIRGGRHPPFARCMPGALTWKSGRNPLLSARAEVKRAFAGERIVRPPADRAYGANSTG